MQPLILHELLYICRRGRGLDEEQVIVYNGFMNVVDLKKHVEEKIELLD